MALVIWDIKDTVLLEILVQSIFTHFQISMMVLWEIKGTVLLEILAQSIFTHFRFQW